MGCKLRAKISWRLPAVSYCIFIGIQGSNYACGRVAYALIAKNEVSYYAYSWRDQIMPPPIQCQGSLMPDGLVSSIKRFKSEGSNYASVHEMSGVKLCLTGSSYCALEIGISASLL